VYLFLGGVQGAIVVLPCTWGGGAEDGPDVWASCSAINGGECVWSRCGCAVLLVVLYLVVGGVVVLLARFFPWRDWARWVAMSSRLHIWSSSISSNSSRGWSQRMHLCWPGVGDLALCCCGRGEGGGYFSIVWWATGGEGGW
jgi:hypothetical protein